MYYSSMQRFNTAQALGLYTDTCACMHKKFQALSQVWQIAALNQRKRKAILSLKSHPTIGK